MPHFTYQDMALSVGAFGGDVTVQLRTLKTKISLDDLAALVYPHFDALEKSQAETPTSS